MITFQEMKWVKVKLPTTSCSGIHMTFETDNLKNSETEKIVKSSPEKRESEFFHNKFRTQTGFLNKGFLVLEAWHRLLSFSH